VTKLILCAVAFILGASVSSTALAQTATLTPLCGFNIYAGARASVAYTNTQVKVSLSGDFTTVPNPVTLSVTPVTGVTYGYSTNNFTNSQSAVYITLGVTNVTKGTYPLTITASTNGAALYTTNITLIVGNLWTNNNVASASWSSGANWSLGAVANGDDVMFQDAGSNTNYVDGSYTLSSLTFIRNISASNQNLTMTSGAKLTVTNGFLVNVDAPQTPATGKTTTLTISGPGAAILVTNNSINAAVCSDNGGSSGTTLIMTNLNTFQVYANRFGVGDFNFAQAGGVGYQLVTASFAKTNLFNAVYTSDYTVSDPLSFAISFINNGTAYNNGSAYTENLGIYNQFQADSMGFGQGRCGSGNSIMQFAPVFTNGIIPYASFRNTNGGRVTLMAVAVDSGTNASGANTKFKLNFNFGYLDILADTMWIARNRVTNYNATPVGSLTFNDGVVDVNTLRLGYQAYSNNISSAYCQGTVTVGGWTNAATLKVNTDLNLGFTSGDQSAGAASAQCYGQVTINTNGTVQANRITVGDLSTNNQVTINAGGTLVLSNTAASSTNSLASLNFNGGALTLSVQAGVTNVFAKVVTVAGTGNKINIASVPYNNTTAATNVIIKYTGADPAAGLGIGTIPPNFNNMSLVTDTTAKTISLVNSANSPKNLVWRGPGTNWDHSSYNWVQVTNAAVPVRFTDGDRVVFDDQAGVYTNITITEVVLPSQSGTGIQFSNSVKNYVFNTNSGTASGIDGGPVLVKNGTAGVEMNAYANVSFQLNEGRLTGTGLISTLSTATNTSLAWAGELVTRVTIGGVATNSGSFDGGVTLNTGSTLTNSGTINGSFTVGSGATLNNSGAMDSIGASTVSAGGYLINSGTLTGNSLNVGGTFFDAGTTIRLTGTLEILGNGTFIPGGSGIGTTVVKQTSNNDPTTAGTLRLDAGSTNIFKADYGSSGQKNTMVLANLVLLGPSQSVAKTNGGGIWIQNVGSTPFANGQSFTLFGAQPSGGSFDPSQFSLNTTNSYPVMIPQYVAVGLTWDVSQAIYNGIVSLVTSTLPEVPTTLTNTVSGNVVTLSWPSDYTGWRLQQQTNSLSVGISTNWTLVAGSTATNSVSITNNPAIPSAFFRLSYPYP